MSRLLVAVLGVALAVATGACGGPQHVHPKGEEYLAGVRIEGNHGIASDDLLPGLALSRTAETGRAFDPYVLALDVTRVRGAYVRLGYFAVDVRARVDHVAGGETVVFVVHEGTRARTRVELIGLPANDPAVAPGKLRQLVALAEGAPFDYEVYDDAKQPLLAAIEDAGYAHAQLGATVIADRTSSEAIARYIFDPGPPCKFGKIEVVGAPGDLEGAVRARVAFDEGGVYSASALAKTQRALYELGRFSTVRVEPDHDLAATNIAVKISVAVSTRHELKFGGGFGYEPLTFDVRGRAGYSVNGCISELTTCTLDGQPAVTVFHDFTAPELKLRALAGLSRMDFLHPFVKGEAELGYDYLTVEAYTYTGPHAKLGISTPLGVPWLLLRVGWLFALYDFLNIDKVVDTATRSQLGLVTERLGVYQQTLVVDLRDNPIAPTKGAYFEARVNEGTALAGGAFTYFQVAPELRGYAPLGKFVLAARAHAGEFLGQVPATERFFSGGATSQRGFNERRLAPTITGVVDTDGSTHSVPVGGAVLVETGLELRTPPVTVRGIDMGVVAFVDGGDVTDTLAEMNLGHLHWATGAGLRIPTPIGAVRLDVGYRLNRTAPEEPEPSGLLRPFAIHFGIGEAY